MRAVLYLSKSDVPNVSGYVFPNELKSDNYSPGIWAIALNSRRGLDDEYDFIAVDNNEEVRTKLIREKGSIYKVVTEKYGTFHFRIIQKYYSHSLRYVGKSNYFSIENIVGMVISLDIKLLSALSLEKGFFFAGMIDRNIQ